MSESARMPRRYLTEAVELPDGRRVTGWKPGRSGTGRGTAEAILRDHLARQVRGVTEAVLPFGRADVLTAAAVYEVEPYRAWRNGVRQVLAYSVTCGLPPVLAVFGTAKAAQIDRVYVMLRDSRPAVGLWWWAGEYWAQITARRGIVNMPHSAAWYAARRPASYG